MLLKQFVLKLSQLLAALRGAFDVLSFPCQSNKFSTDLRRNVLHFMKLISFMMYTNVKLICLS